MWSGVVRNYGESGGVVRVTHDYAALDLSLAMSTLC